MAKNKEMPAKLNNIATFQFYLNYMVTLANSVFTFENASYSLNPLWINDKLLRRGSIAFFRDDVTEELTALPYNVIGKRDKYNRPIKIRCIGQNGYQSDVLDFRKKEFVIMYDNLSYMPLYGSILQLAERMARHTRTIDININQQRTPRILKTSNNKELSVKSFLRSVENYEEAIVTYKDMDLDDLEAVMMPAPYVADKVWESKQNTWNEFCNLVGISTIPVEKKERLISSEVIASMGGNYIGRYSRYTPRKYAIDMINDFFGTDLKLVCYDEELREEIKELEEKEEIEE